MYSHCITLLHYVHICIFYTYAYVYTAVRGKHGHAHASHVCVCARARVRVRFGHRRIRSEPCERLPVGVDRGWLGAQAFYSASAFNANIGAWNTAAVTTFVGVCAAFGPGGAPPRAAAC